MHSYTRCNKERVFEKLMRSEEAASAPKGGSQPPLHMQMTACILERLYTDYPEAVICIYVISPPQWMQSWCANILRIPNAPGPADVAQVLVEWASCLRILS